ncbi:MAG: hypothetical protein U9R26_07075 [Campylobacterota bacterium]|nr:hypothetical protein [Campylobacterota bacterium]
MTWKRYQNEIIVLAALVLMAAGYLYKSSSANSLDLVKAEVALSATEAGEIIALKKQWGNAKLTESVNKMNLNIAPAKIKQFSIKSKKLQASYRGLSDKEMNGIIVKLQNIAVQIAKLGVKRKGDSYNMEIVCKW